MVSTHTRGNINRAEYKRVNTYIFIGMRIQSTDDATKKDVLAILWSLKRMIIS